MLRVNAFFLVVIVASSFSFATPKDTTSGMKSQELVRKQHLEAKKLYQKAFQASFYGDWKTAKSASEGAAKLENGTSRWNLEAFDLIH